MSPTVMQVVAGLPSGGAPDHVTVDVVLQMYTGGTMFGAVTFNVSVQDAPGSIVTPVRLMLGVVGVATATPPHVLTSPFGLVTRNPPGSTSVNPTFVIWSELGFDRVNVNAMTAPGSTNFVAKAFIRTGGLLVVIMLSVSVDMFPSPVSGAFTVTLLM